VQHAADEVAVRAGDHAAAFHGEAHRRESGRHERALVGGLDRLADVREVHGGLLGPVRDADAAAEVEKLDAHAHALLHLDREVEKHLRRLDEILGVELVRRHHGVQAEALHALVAQHAVAFEKLLAREAVLGLLGLTDDRVAGLERAGIVAEAHELRQASAECGFEKLDVAEVVEVDQRAHLVRFLKLLCRSVVRGEDDVLAAEAGGLAQAQFGQRRAVAAHAHLAHQIEDVRVGQRLDRKEVLKPAGHPGKRAVKRLGVGAHGGFVVQVERRADLGGDGLQLAQREGKAFVGHDGVKRLN